MTITQKLQKIQKYSGKTQEDLARDLDVSFPTLNSWINGKSQPRKKAVEKINSLYLETFGDISIGIDELDKKIEKLQQLKKQFSDPFSVLLTKKDIYDDFLLSLTYHSNSIEGSTFNGPDVKAVLFDDVTIPNKSVREHQEAKNHQGALGFVMRWIRDDNNFIDEEFIKHIHQILMNGIMHNAGEYRNHNVRIAGANIPTSNHMSIDKHMSEYIDEFNQLQKDLLTQVEQIAQTHARFEQIHPFSDGNGRVGRLLMLILAFKYTIAPILIKKEKKQAYYTYLGESQVKTNHIPLTSFILDAIFEGYKLLAK
ncbi:MAG: Fic family protein [Patescibacteria group bacterium]|nr:Fic family protein [Patescibacteria group bacterium]